MTLTVFVASLLFTSHPFSPARMPTESAYNCQSSHRAHTIVNGDPRRVLPAGQRDEILRSMAMREMFESPRAVGGGPRFAGQPVHAQPYGPRIYRPIEPLP